MRRHCPGRAGRIIVALLALLAAVLLCFTTGGDLFDLAPGSSKSEIAATAGGVLPAKGSFNGDKTFGSGQGKQQNVESVSGQQRPPARGGEPGIRAFANITFHLQRVEQLRSPAVQRRLGLNPQQKREVQPLFDQAEKLSQTIRDVPSEQMERELERLYVPAADRYRRVLDEVLSERQQFGLFRLVLKEQRGALGLLMPGVAEELQLRSRQRERIETMIAKNWESVDWANVGWLDVPELLRLARKERAAAENLLSPAQQQRWQELLDDEGL